MNSEPTWNLYCGNSQKKENSTYASLADLFLVPLTSSSVILGEIKIFHARSCFMPRGIPHIKHGETHWIPIVLVLCVWGIGISLFVSPRERKIPNLSCATPATSIFCSLWCCTSYFWWCTSPVSQTWRLVTSVGPPWIYRWIKFGLLRTKNLWVICIGLWD